MDEASFNHLTKRVGKLEREAARLRMGIVTSASPLQITIAGGTTELDARYLDSYTPVVNDIIAVLTQGKGRPVVLGKLA